MSIGKYIMHVLVAFFAYFALYTLFTVVIFGDVYAANADLMRSEDDPLALYIMIGHLLQTCMVVVLFNMAVGSNDMKRGAIFGAVLGAYLAGTDMTYYFGLKMATDPVVIGTIVHLVVGAIIGVLLAFLNGFGNKAAEEG